MDILTRVSEKRKCAASIDWNSDFTKAVLSFGDKEKPKTDVEVVFTVNQLAELGCVAMEAELAGNEGRSRLKAKYAKTAAEIGASQHHGSC